MDWIPLKLLFGVTLLFLISLPSTSTTAPCSWTKANATCPKEFHLEVYTRLKNNTKQKLCCSKQDLKESLLKTAHACQTTICLVNTTKTNPCHYLPEKYFIGGQPVIKNESLREPCTHPSSKLPGIAAICCKPNSIANLLISGYGAEQNEFPHQARVMPVMCGGTVYSKDTIITAAHCLVSNGIVNRNSSTHVVLGTNLGNHKGTSNHFPVKSIIVHSNYSDLKNSSVFGQNIFYNDIALLKLGKEIDFKANPNIKSLKIAPEGFEPLKYGRNAIIVGWGTSEDLTLTEHLQKANFILRSDKRCFKEHPFHKNMEKYSNQLLCVGGVLDGTYSYTAGGGDSGGPAVCRDANGLAILCGVTSYGGDDKECRDKYDEESCPPSAYAEVSYFHKWIKEKGGEQDSKTFFQAYLYGRKVDIKDYPNQVRITSKTGPKCGGTLVSPNMVVTTGHCLLEDDGKVRKEIKVEALGLNYTVKENGIFYQKGFRRYWKIESLNSGKGNKFQDPPYADNIAWLKLNKSVPIEAGKLAKLPNQTYPVGQATEISYQQEFKSFGERNFTILDGQECKRRVERFKVLKMNVTFDEKKVFCGVERYSGGSICDRELGGGLFCKGVFCGVQSFRLCQYALPNVFMNVNNYVGGIRDAIKL